MLLGGFACNLVDTAGLRDTADALESIGVARTKQAVAEADLVLLVVDLSTGILPEDEAILAALSTKPVLIVGNKVDLADDGGERLADFAGAIPRVMVSARNGSGLDALARQVRELITGGKAVSAGDQPLITRARHYNALLQGREHLEEAIAAWERGLPADLIAIDLWAAISSLGEITGAAAREDLVDRIFSEFCIGK
jgi:tRNA modification GTPase